MQSILRSYVWTVTDRRFPRRGTLNTERGSELFFANFSSSQWLGKTFLESNDVVTLWRCFCVQKWPLFLQEDQLISRIFHSRDRKRTRGGPISSSPLHGPFLPPATKSVNDKEAKVVSNHNFRLVSDVADPVKTSTLDAVVADKQEVKAPSTKIDPIVFNPFEEGS